MAYVLSKNQLPTSGAAYWYMLKTLLVSCGWTVTRSGTGTGATYSASSDLITSAAVLSQGGAWFILKQPAAYSGGQRQLTVQNELTPIGELLSWRVKYSYNTGFTVGTSNATTTPSATDEVTLLGSGTDAAPGFWSMFDQFTTRRAHFIANNAAPYEFVALIHPSGGGTVRHVFMMDAMVAGSYDVLDVDPYVFYGDGASPFSTAYFRTAGGAAVGPKAWFKKGIAGAAFQAVSGWVYNDSNGTVVPSVIGTDAASSKDQVYPVFFGRNPALGAPAGPKGQSTLMAWCSNLRNCGDTLNVVGSKDKICMSNGTDCAAFPWDGTTPSV